MNSIAQSAPARRINAQLSETQLAEAIALLKKANRYVGSHASIGGQVLGIQITEFVTAYQNEHGQEQTQ
jgi:hypothetical protein